jgi:hypothetical protein
MDIFQRAADIFDRAQDRVSIATNQAARVVANAAQIRALEARQAALRERIDHATTDLGRLTFHRWKSKSPAAEPSMAALCQHIDMLNMEYQQVLSELAAARTIAGSYLNPPYPVPPPASAPLPPLPPAESSYPAPFIAPVAEVRPEKPVRECPECYSLVPGTTDFCPSCGMRV